jgi:hypothetical protein
MKRQHAATSISPGFVQGASDLRQKYFPQSADAYSAQRFFFRPTSDLNGTHPLALNMTQGNLSTFWDEGGVSCVRWDTDTLDARLTVRAWVGGPPPLSSPSFIPSGTCPVYYTVDAEFSVYTFYSQSGAFDPAQPTATPYTGQLSNGSQYTIYLSGVNSPVVFGDVSFSQLGSETNFVWGQFTGQLQLTSRKLVSWFTTYSLPLTDQQIRNASLLGVPVNGLFWEPSRSGYIGTLYGALCVPADSGNPLQVTTGSVSIPYVTRPRQWLASPDNNWITNPAFSVFEYPGRGALMSVQGSLSQYRYAQTQDTSFQAEFQVEVG